MGFDVTIKHTDGQPLGEIAEVQRTLAEVFPGIVLFKSPSGPEKLQRAAEQGVQFPEFLRQQIEATLPEYEGVFETSGFSAEFHLGSSETVETVDVVLHGDMGSAEATFATLGRYGWIVTHP